MDSQLIKEIAHYIIMSHTEDIEFLSIWEMTEDRVLNENPDLPLEQIEMIVRQVDDMIGRAEVTITFKD